MATVTHEPDARHGKTRLCIIINDDVYSARKVGTRVRLRKMGGERAGIVYWVRRDGPGVGCSCPDTLHHPDGRCKHIGAVLACRLLPTPKGGGR